MIEDGNPRTISDFPMAENDMQLALHAFKLGILRDLQICFPACIYSYDRSTHTATVMPLVKQGYFNGEWHYLRRQLIKDIRVRNIQCGGFTIDFPVYVGDTGWVFSSDRDTQLLKQMGMLTTAVLSGNRSQAIVEDDYQQQPSQPSLHLFSDGFFIPDNWGNWETHRYKDNPAASVGTSLYIGSSIDTNDDKDDSGDRKFQKGDAYEKKVTSSLSMQSNGGISLASSSPTKAEKEGDDDPPKKNVNMTIAEKQATITATNEDARKSASISVDADDGIIIRQDVETEEDKAKQVEGQKQNFLCTISPGKFTLRVVDSSDDSNPPKILSFFFADGKLNVMASGDLNLNLGGTANIKAEKGINVFSKGQANVTALDGVNVKAEKDVYVSAANARVVAKENASVAAEKVSASATGDINVASGNVLNVGAVKETNINGGERVSIVGGAEVSVAATKVKVETEEAQVVADKKASVVAPAVHVGNGGFDENGILKYENDAEIQLLGKVAISGELTLNEIGFEPAIHGLEENVKYWKQVE